MSAGIARRGRSAPEIAALVAWLGPVLVFAVVPVAVLVGRSATALDRAAWAELAGEGGPLWNTVSISVGAALFALALGAPLSFLLTRTDLPLRGAFAALFTLPAAVPPFIWGMGWLALANPRAGLLNRAFGEGTFDVYGPAGIAFVLGLSGLPLVLLGGAAALRRVDPALEESARVAGASAMGAIFGTTFPLVLPSLLSAAVMVFLTSASAFGVPYILGVSASPPTQVLTTRIYGHVLLGGGEHLARAMALSGALLALTPIALWASHRLGRAGRVRLSAGKGLSLRPLRLGSAKAPITALVALACAILIVLPLGAIALTSLQRTWGAPLTPEHFTLSHWSGVLLEDRTIRAAARSGALAAGAAALVCVFGLGAALLRRRIPGRMGRAIEPLAAWAYAVPGTVLAMALLIAFSRDLRFIALERVAFVLALAHTLWLLLVAYSAKYLALGAQGTSEALSQVDPSLAEAARVSGAGPVRAFKDAVLPVLRPALAAAFLLTFLVCATEITMSVLLVPAGADVLGTLLFELQSYADPASAAVLACAFVALVVAGQAAIAALGRRGAR